MDHSLQTISYIADIGSLVVLMARRKLPRRSEVAEEKRLYKMICHVFHSPDVRQRARPSEGRAALGSWRPSRCHERVLWVSVLGAPDKRREGEEPT